MSKEFPSHPIQLIEVNTKKIDAEKFEGEIKNDKININFEPDISYESIDNQNFYINFKVKITTEPQELFRIIIELTGKCLTEEEDYNIEKFAQDYGTGIMWPYARELVSNITQRFGFPALVLPTLRVGKK